MSVFAIDGSKYTLPATEEIRAAFDPQSGLQSPGKGHYPQCLVSTVYDVFRRFPIGRHIGPINASEREQAIMLLPCIPANSLAIYDRGYPSYKFLKELQNKFTGYFMMRCSSRFTFPAVEQFIKTDKQEDIVYLRPSLSYLEETGVAGRNHLKPLKIRVIKLKSPDGTLSVVLTNLWDRKKYPAQEIIDLYAKRWEIETYYRDEKKSLDIEQFHGQTCNSIRQELFAAAIMAVISRILMVLSTEFFDTTAHEVQFKNTIMSLASEAAVLAPEDPEKAVIIFTEILREISRVKYYRPKVPRLSQRRITKKAINKWAIGKLKKTGNA